MTFETRQQRAAIGAWPDRNTPRNPRQVRLPDLGPPLGWPRDERPQGAFWGGFRGNLDTTHRLSNSIIRPHQLGKPLESLETRFFDPGLQVPLPEDVKEVEIVVARNKDQQFVRPRRAAYEVANYLVPQLFLF